jgi:hypothetical protein
MAPSKSCQGACIRMKNKLFAWAGIGRCQFESGGAACAHFLSVRRRDEIGPLSKQRRGNQGTSERCCCVYVFAAQMTAGNSWVRTVSCTLNNGAQIMRLQMSPAARLLASAFCVLPTSERLSTAGWHPLYLYLPSSFLLCEFATLTNLMSVSTRVCEKKTKRMIFV